MATPRTDLTSFVGAVGIDANGEGCQTGGRKGARDRPGRKRPGCELTGAPPNPPVLHVIERIVAPLGLRVDESSPWVDARLSDGSRVQTQLLRA